MVVVLFELDEDTKEATGLVHPFCSEPCRSKYQEDAPPEGIEYSEGFDGTNDESQFENCAFVCTHCKKPI
jgi:hypothetical protein